MYTFNTAEEFKTYDLGTKALNWLLSKSEIVVLENGDMQAHFIGMLPSYMATNIDRGTKMYFRNEREELAMSISFGQYRSNANKINFSLFYNTDK